MTATASNRSAIVSPRDLGATVTLHLGVALLAFKGFLVPTALPNAVEELGGVALLSWATTVFLVFAIMGGTGARTALIAAPSSWRWSCSSCRGASAPAARVDRSSSGCC